MKCDCSYNTTSNNVRVIKTPGGKLRLLHIKKRGTAPKCGDCGIKLPGVSSIHDQCSLLDCNIFDLRCYCQKDPTLTCLML